MIKETAPVKLSLDWNCVIEVEDDRAQAKDVVELIRLHRRGDIEVALLAASASENTKSQEFPKNATLFRDRIAKLGWESLPLVPMPCVIGLTYIGCTYIVKDAAEYKALVDALRSVIAPNLARRPHEYLGNGQTLDDGTIGSRELQRWRNYWCDVHSAYSHIKAGRDVFVTCNTRDFQKHRSKLAQLGMGCIVTPEEAVKLMRP